MSKTFYFIMVEMMFMQVLHDIFRKIEFACSSYLFIHNINI